MIQLELVIQVCQVLRIGDTIGDTIGIGDTTVPGVEKTNQRISLCCSSRLEKGNLKVLISF